MYNNRLEGKKLILKTGEKSKAFRKDQKDVEKGTGQRFVKKSDKPSAKGDSLFFSEKDSIALGGRDRATWISSRTDDN